MDIRDKMHSLSLYSGVDPELIAEQAICLPMWWRWTIPAVCCGKSTSMTESFILKIKK